MVKLLLFSVPISVFLVIQALTTAAAAFRERNRESLPVSYDSFECHERLSHEQIFFMGGELNERHFVTVFRATSVVSKLPLIVMAYSSQMGFESERAFSERMEGLGGSDSSQLFLLPVGFVCQGHEEPEKRLKESGIMSDQYYGVFIFQASAVPFVRYMASLKQEEKLAVVSQNMDRLVRALLLLKNAKAVHGRLSPSHLFVIRGTASSVPLIKLGGFAGWGATNTDYPIHRGGASRYTPPELIPLPEAGRPMSNRLVEGSQFHPAIDAWSLGMIMMEQLGFLPPQIAKCSNVFDQLYMTFCYLYPREPFTTAIHVRLAQLREKYDKAAAALQHARKHFAIHQLTEELKGRASEDGESLLARVTRSDRQRYEDQFNRVMAELRDEYHILTRTLKVEELEVEDHEDESVLEKRRLLKKERLIEETMAKRLGACHIDRGDLTAKAMVFLVPTMKDWLSHMALIASFIKSSTEAPLAPDGVLKVPHLQSLFVLEPSDRMQDVQEKLDDSIGLSRSPSGGLGSRLPTFSMPKSLDQRTAPFMRIYGQLSNEKLIQILAFFIFVIVYAMA